MYCRTHRWVGVSLLILVTGCDSTSDSPAWKSAISALTSLNSSVEEAGDAERIKAYKQLKNAIIADPKDTDPQVEMLGLLTSVGFGYYEKNDQQKVNAIFETAIELADLLELDQKTAPDHVRGLLQQVYYYGACAQAQKGETFKAVESLEQARRWGFDQFEMLRGEDDLREVRSLAGFEVKMREWIESVRQAAFEEAKAELARADSFPFDFAVTDINGKDVKLADFIGKVVVIDVWGTWCPPCREEIPSFIRLQDTFGAAGFQVIGLNYEHATGDAAVKLVSDCLVENGVNYPCALGDEVIQSQIPNFGSFPITIFIDKTGKVRLKVSGTRRYGFLEAVVSLLLAEPEADAS